MPSDTLPSADGDKAELARLEVLRTDNFSFVPKAAATRPCYYACAYACCPHLWARRGSMASSALSPLTSMPKPAPLSVPSGRDSYTFNEGGKGQDALHAKRDSAYPLRHEGLHKHSSCGTLEAVAPTAHRLRAAVTLNSTVIELL